jgi:hypothetical protein
MRLPSLARIADLANHPPALGKIAFLQHLAQTTELA